MNLFVAGNPRIYSWEDVTVINIVAGKNLLDLLHDDVIAMAIFYP